MQGRVLLAVSAVTRQRLLPCLAGRETVWAETAGQVCAAAAREHFDLVVVGSHFAESSCFDIIRRMKRIDPYLRIVCVRGVTFSGLGPSTMKAFRIACEAIGCRVIDLFEYADDESGRRAIRELFEQALASPEISSHP